SRHHLRDAGRRLQRGGRPRAAVPGAGRRVLRRLAVLRASQRLGHSRRLFRARVRCQGPAAVLRTRNILDPAAFPGLGAVGLASREITQTRRSRRTQAAAAAAEAGQDPRTAATDGGPVPAPEAEPSAASALAAQATFVAASEPTPPPASREGPAQTAGAAALKQPAS